MGPMFSEAAAPVLSPEGPGPASSPASLPNAPCRSDGSAARLPAGGEGAVRTRRGGLLCPRCPGSEGAPRQPAPWLVPRLVPWLAHPEPRHWALSAAHRAETGACRSSRDGAGGSNMDTRRAEVCPKPSILILVLREDVAGSVGPTQGLGEKARPVQLCWTLLGPGSPFAPQAPLISWPWPQSGGRQEC